MQKRFTAMAVCIILILSMAVAPCSVSAVEFLDVPLTASYYKAVDKLSNEGVIQGRGDGVFDPSNNTTRAEFCAFLARANNYNPAYYKTTKTPFSDVAKGNWAEGYISFCYENGYVNGMDAQSFAPTNNVTCEQAVKMVVCASGVGDESLSKVGPKWYSGYINVARRNNLLDGVDVKVGSPASRAFVAQVVYNSMIIKGEDKSSNHAVDVSGNNTGREVVDSGEPTKPIKYEPEEIWEPEPEDVEWNYYQYYGEDYEKYMEEDEGSDKYTIAEEEVVYVPRGSSEGMLVVIDPGHNYNTVDTGATGNGLREQDITYFIAEKLKPLLERNGFEVIMTRNSLKENVSTESVSASLARRAEIANTAGADLFISIHCNAGGGTGTESYYCVGSGLSKIFAGFLQDGMVEAVGLSDRGVKSARYAVLRNTDMVAALLETAFIDNEGDADYLADEEYQRAFAEGIARGVCDYVGIEYK